MKLPGRFSVIVLMLLFLAGGRSPIAGAAQPNYDPPKPSADFGTKEATATIAANSMPLDIVGIKLGLPLKAAQAAVNAHNASLKLDPQLKFEFEAMPGTPITPVYSGQSQTADGGLEYVGVLTTSVPNEQFVYSIWRDFSFGKPETRPTIDNIVSGLRTKYGPESVRDDTLLLWLFDAQKHQVMGARAKDIWQKCGNHWMAGTYYDPRTIQSQLSGGFYSVTDGKDYSGGTCHSHSRVQVRYQADQPPGASQPLVMKVQVTVANHQLQASGVTATYALVSQEAGKLADKRQQEASKRAGPKF